jgi:hypothetical protein
MVTARKDERVGIYYKSTAPHRKGIAEAANSLGLTLSEFIEKSLRAYMKKHHLNPLPPRTRSGSSNGV